MSDGFNIDFNAMSADVERALRKLRPDVSFEEMLKRAAVHFVGDESRRRDEPLSDDELRLLVEDEQRYID